jgi:hypothetical protein
MTTMMMMISVGGTENTAVGIRFGRKPDLAVKLNTYR